MVMHSQPVDVVVTDMDVDVASDTLLVAGYPSSTSAASFGAGKGQMLPPGKLAAYCARAHDTPKYSGPSFLG